MSVDPPRFVFVSLREDSSHWNISTERRRRMPATDTGNRGSERVSSEAASPTTWTSLPSSAASGASPDSTQAVSPAGAAGLWQFMSTAAKEYGLEVNANVDERYHIEKATIAACRYLKRSYARFGNWMSVAASYNAGPGAIATRMEAQQEKRAEDLWLLNETSRYMFRMLAAKMMFEDPAAFGFSVPEEDRYPVMQVKQVVEVTDPIPDLTVFAKEHGVSFAQLKRANLWLRESKLNNNSHRSYEIIIPQETGRPQSGE